VPTIKDKNLLEEEQGQQAGGNSLQTTSGDSATAGGTTGGVSSGQTQSGGGSFAGREGSRSGSFTNLRNYMEGNKRGSAQTTQKLQGASQQRSDTAQQNITGEQDRLTGATTGIQDTAMGKIGAASGAVTDFRALQDDGTQPNQPEQAPAQQEAQPQQAAPEAGQPTAWQQQATNLQGTIQSGVMAGDEAKRGLENVNVEGQVDRLGQVQEANEFARSLTSEAGRQEALKRVANRPNTYSRGESALDTALTGTDTNMQRLQQESQRVQAMNLQQQATDLETNLQTEKAKVMEAVNAGLIGTEEAEGLIGQIERNANEMKQELLASQAQLFANAESMAAADSVTGVGQVEALRRSGVNVVDTLQGQMVDLGGGNLIPVDKFMQANADPESKLGFDITNRLTAAQDIGLETVDRERAAKVNALANMLNLPVEALEGVDSQQIQDMMAGNASIENIEGIQEFDPTDAMQYNSSVANLGDVFTNPAIGQNFERLKGVSGDVEGAQHYASNFQSARNDVFNEAKAGGGRTIESMLSRLDPQQQEGFRNAAAEYQKQAAAVDAYRNSFAGRRQPTLPKELSRSFNAASNALGNATRSVVDQGLTNAQTKNAAISALQNSYGKGISYEDIRTDLKPVTTGIY